MYRTMCSYHCKPVPEHLNKELCLQMNQLSVMCSRLAVANPT